MSVIKFLNPSSVPAGTDQYSSSSCIPSGHLAPDFKTIADFRKDNGEAIREVCRTFVALCRELDLLSVASVAIDGSKFKAI